MWSTSFIYAGVGFDDLEPSAHELALRGVARPEPGGDDRMVERLNVRPLEKTEQERTAGVKAARELAEGHRHSLRIGMDH